jgi:hypothetical protein
MKIAFESVTNKILGTGEIAGAVEYAGTIPADFNDTLGLGKYTFDGTTITPVANWVAPPIVKLL